MQPWYRELHCLLLYGESLSNVLHLFIYLLVFLPLMGKKALKFKREMWWLFSPALYCVFIIQSILVTGCPYINLNQPELKTNNMTKKNALEFYTSRTILILVNSWRAVGLSESNLVHALHIKSNFYISICWISLSSVPRNNKPNWGYSVILSTCNKDDLWWHFACQAIGSPFHNMKAD